MDDKLNLCLGSEGELWQSDLSWEWRVRVRRNWAPQGTRRWQIHPARCISEAFCFESWLLTSDPHPSSCQPLKDASPCQGSSAPQILVIHFTDRLRPTLSWKERGWNIYFCTITAEQIWSHNHFTVSLSLQVAGRPQNVYWAGRVGRRQQSAWKWPPVAQVTQAPHPDTQ